MRTLAAVGWLMIPVAFVAYHHGPGQEKLALDDAARVLADADRAAGAEDWDRAVALYDRALPMIPADRPVEARRVRLERDKARMFARQLPEAAADLTLLVEEIARDGEDAPLLDESRAALANAQYHLTWLKRLEGLAREEWEPDIEGARQTFRLLAHRARVGGDRETATRRKQDLESSIRLARMDLSELQGLSLPSQCRGCKSGQCKKPGRKPNPNGKKPQDARGASNGPPPDGSGS